MKSHRPTSFVRSLAAGAMALAGMCALAQTSPLPVLPGAPDRAASVPGAGDRATGPRLRSPAETGNRAAAPGDLQPERPVTPQISIPFGKKPPPPTQREERAVQRGKPASTAGVDDAAARCEAQIDHNLRASCRAKLARHAKERAPN